MNCAACNGTEGVRLYGAGVDGELLRLQVPLCTDHGDRYLMRVGAMMGRLLSSTWTTRPKQLAQQAAREIYAAAERVAETSASTVRFFIVVAVPGDDNQPVFDAGGNGSRPLSRLMLEYAVNAHELARKDVDG
jgi:hypothetical protein